MEIEDINLLIKEAIRNSFEDIDAWLEEFPEIGIDEVHFAPVDAE